MAFQVNCINNVLCGLASTNKNTVTNMTSLPGGDLITWKPLSNVRVWTQGAI